MVIQLILLIPSTVFRIATPLKWIWNWNAFDLNALIIMHMSAIQKIGIGVGVGVWSTIMLWNTNLQPPYTLSDHCIFVEERSTYHLPSAPTHPTVHIIL